MRSLIAKLLLILVVIILILIAVITLCATCAVYLGLGTGAGIALGWVAVGLFVLAAIVDPELVGTYISRIGEVVNDVIDEIGDGIGEVVEDVIDALGINLTYVALGLGGLALYMFLSPNSNSGGNSE